MTALDEVLTMIAREHLGIPTLETRLSDSLDFHDVAVWQVEAALKAAYRLGRAAERVLHEKPTEKERAP